MRGIQKYAAKKIRHITHACVVWRYTLLSQMPFCYSEVFCSILRLNKSIPLVFDSAVCKNPQGFAFGNRCVCKFLAGLICQITQLVHKRKKFRVLVTHIQKRRISKKFIE